MRCCSNGTVWYNVGEKSSAYGIIYVVNWKGPVFRSGLRTDDCRSAIKSRLGT